MVTESRHEQNLESMAEWIVTHKPDISPELVGSRLADAEAPIETLLRGEERSKALRERADAISWLREEAAKRGYPMALYGPKLAQWIKDFLRVRPESAFSAADIQAAMVRFDMPAPSVGEMDAILQELQSLGEVDMPVPTKYRYVGRTAERRAKRQAPSPQEVREYVNSLGSDAATIWRLSSGEISGVSVEQALENLEHLTPYLRPDWTDRAKRLDEDIRRRFFS